MRVSVKILFGFLALFYKGGLVKSSCYFQQEFQGEYVMQSSISAYKIQYTTLNITATSIPVWGHCHKRIGNKYILRMSHEETSCIRCVHLKLRSPNILQMIANHNTFSKCHISEELVEKRCPGEESLKFKNTTETLLFKTKDMSQYPTTPKHCPLDGKYSVIYNGKNTRSFKKSECVGIDSTMDSCPNGSTLNIKLKGCNFDNIDFKLHCLGSWNGMKEEKFVIFSDTRQQKPKYRCAVYEKERETGRIFMALSNDSTCSTDLYNSTSGSETFILSPRDTTPWPTDVAWGECYFPEWMQGEWEHIRVNGDTLIYQDITSFKTYTIKCAGFQEMENKYVVFSRTQCNEEYYTCMWIHKRTDNILEFQMGTKFSQINNPFELCLDNSFDQDSWITQGRISTQSRIHSGMCPISGEYTGVIPDAPDLCAKMWSNCSDEIMYYEVSSCETKEIYEEREYRCLGHWKEGNLLYTYTERMDVAEGTYECFVGSITPTKEIYIKEAGSFCQRNIDPIRNGMQLVKKRLYTCLTDIPKTEEPSMDFKPTTAKSTTTRTTTITRATQTTVKLTKSTRKPWNFDNDMNEINPRGKNPNKASDARWSLILYVLCICSVMIMSSPQKQW